MSMRELDDIVHRAESLTPDEMLQLAAMLIQRVRAAEEAGPNLPRWSDLLGLVPEPALGEEAQAWVTRTRQEDGDIEDR